MIKWDYYGKLLKLSFFGLLISCFTILGSCYVKAELIHINDTVFVGLGSTPSNLDGNYDLTFLKGGGLMTTYLGYGRSFTALNGHVLFFWTPEGLPYFYAEGDNYVPTVQGYFDSYYSCDELTGYFGPQNCSLGGTIDTGDNSTNKTIWINFFNQVAQGDLVYYQFDQVGSEGISDDINYGTFCFSSDSIGKSICFKGGMCDALPSHCQNYQGGLHGSLGFSNLNFTNLAPNYIGYAPGQNGYNGQYNGSSEGAVEGNYESFLTGDLVYKTCTNGYVKNRVEQLGMSKYVCYGGLPLTGNGIAIAGTGASVFDIFQATTDSQNFSDWFTYWQGIYNHRYVYNQDIWSGVAPLFSYFNFVNQYGPDFTSVDIQEYCRIIVYDLPLTGKFTGIKSWCEFGSNNGDGYFSDSYGTGGDYAVGVNWNGVGNIEAVLKDPIPFIQDFFNKLKANFPTDFSGIGGGFLPTYLIMFLLAILLFRFLSH